MAKKSASKSEAPKPEAPKTEESTPVQASMTQTDAVKAAIAEGFDKPSAGSEFIQKTYGLKVTPKYFSIIKSKVAPGAAKATTTKRGPKPKAAPTAVKTASTGSDTFEELKKLKELKERVGAKTFEEMIQFLG